jgi:hypothetical protein
VGEAQLGEAAAGGSCKKAFLTGFHIGKGSADIQHGASSPLSTENVKKAANIKSKGGKRKKKCIKGIDCTAMDKEYIEQIGPDRVPVDANGKCMANGIMAQPNTITSSATKMFFVSTYAAYVYIINRLSTMLCPTKYDESLEGKSGQLCCNAVSGAACFQGYGYKHEDCKKKFGFERKFLEPKERKNCEVSTKECARMVKLNCKKGPDYNPLKNEGPNAPHVEMSRLQLGEAEQIRADAEDAKAREKDTLTDEEWKQVAKEFKAWARVAARKIRAHNWQELGEVSKAKDQLQTGWGGRRRRGGVFGFVKKAFKKVKSIGGAFKNKAIALVSKLLPADLRGSLSKLIKGDIKGALAALLKNPKYRKIVTSLIDRVVPKVTKVFDMRLYLRPMLKKILVDHDYMSAAVMFAMMMIKQVHKLVIVFMNLAFGKPWQWWDCFFCKKLFGTLLNPNYVYDIDTYMARQYLGAPLRLIFQKFTASRFKDGRVQGGHRENVCNYESQINFGLCHPLHQREFSYVSKITKKRVTRKVCEIMTQPSKPRGKGHNPSKYAMGPRFTHRDGTAIQIPKKCGESCDPNSQKVRKWLAPAMKKNSYGSKVIKFVPVRFWKADCKSRKSFDTCHEFDDAKKDKAKCKGDNPEDHCWPSQGPCQWRYKDIVNPNPRIGRCVNRYGETPILKDKIHLKGSQCTPNHGTYTWPQNPELRCNGARVSRLVRTLPGPMPRGEVIRRHEARKAGKQPENHMCKETLPYLDTFVTSTWAVWTTVLTNEPAVIGCQDRQCTSLKECNDSHGKGHECKTCSISCGECTKKRPKWMKASECKSRCIPSGGTHVVLPPKKRV